MPFSPHATTLFVAWQNPSPYPDGRGHPVFETGGGVEGRARVTVGSLVWLPVGLLVGIAVKISPEVPVCGGAQVERDNTDWRSCLPDD